MKILIVDDDPVVLMLVRTWLESEGHEVMTQDRSFGTSNLVMRERPNVVLLDIEMPGLSGEVLASILVEMTVKYPMDIIFLSGRSRAELDALARKHGVLGYVAKGNDGRAFLEEFRRVLATGRSQKPTTTRAAT